MPEVFELADGWDAAGIGGVVLVPFAGQRVILAGGRLLEGAVGPGEHWSVVASGLLGRRTGARLQPSQVDDPTLHPFGILHGRPSGPRVVAWCEALPPERWPEGVCLAGRREAGGVLDPDAVPLYELAADLRARGVDDATWTRDAVRMLEEHYLREEGPEAQSGKGGGAADWELARRLVVRPVHHDGSFLDLGCANGLLMESVRRWAAEDGRELEPYGLDASARLVELARRRLPAWRDRLFVGDALTWTPPRRFDFVHTMPDLVPGRRRPAWLRRVLDEFVAPGGRLIVRDYAGVGDTLRAWGLPVAGATIQERGARPAQEAAWLDAPR